MSNSIEDKRQAIIETERNALVVGGPGSGKTTLALHKAIKRINDGLLPGQKILFLSFSRAAVARIVDAAKSSFDTKNLRYLSIHTFHSFFWELLKTHGHLLGPKKVSLLLPQYEKVMSNGAKTNSSDWKQWLKQRDTLFHEEGLIAFDLFAPKAFELLSKSNLIREIISSCYPLIIVDEAQDTNLEVWKCIEILARKSQVICLADTEQQIFDHLPGVDPERLTRIQEALNPLYVDLGTTNNRSPNTEILGFANDVLSSKIQNREYAGVLRIGYKPQELEKAIRQAVGFTLTKYKEMYGQHLDSLAVLTSYGSGVIKVTTSLNKASKPIYHKVLMDETEVLLASRFVAYLLEPKSSWIGIEIATCLEVLSDLKKAVGTKTALAEAAKFQNWANALKASKKVKNRIVDDLWRILLELEKIPLTGNPKNDWLYVKALLINAADGFLSRIATNLDYLVAFNRGKLISANLSDLWLSQGNYKGARDAFDKAIAQDTLLSDLEGQEGIHVMTIHKSKGKQFDAVLLVREAIYAGPQSSSSFLWRDDKYPFPRSRKILRVGITRARKLVVILDPHYPKCPISG